MKLNVSAGYVCNFSNYPQFRLNRTESESSVQAPTLSEKAQQAPAALFFKLTRPKLV